MSETLKVVLKNQEHAHVLVWILWYYFIMCTHFYCYNLIHSQLIKGLGSLMNSVFMYMLDNVRKLELQLRLCIPLLYFLSNRDHNFLFDSSVCRCLTL